MAAKNNALQEISVNHSNLFVDENNVTIDFNRTNTLKSELTHYFNSNLPDLADIEEMIITDVIQSEISPEYIHVDMVIKRSIKKRRPN